MTESVMNKSIIMWNLSAQVSYVETTSIGNYGNSAIPLETIVMSQRDYPQYKAAMMIIRYVLPIIVFGGTVGNVLSFVVLMRQRMRNTSVYFYLAMLACADTCVLYLSGFKTWVRVTTGFEMLHVSWVGCKTIMFIFMVTAHLSAWLVVAMTADRFVIVWCPLRVPLFCDIYRARVVTFLMTLALCLYKLHLFWTIDLLHLKGKTKCASIRSSYFMVSVYPLLKLASYTIVPFVIVLVLNTLITYKLWKNRKAFQTMLRRNRDHPSHKSTQYRVTVMLLTVSFVWLLLTAPFTLRSLMDNVQVVRSSQDKASYFLAKTICFMLMYLNHGVNFILYCLTGNKFRSELSNAFTLRQRPLTRDISLRTCTTTKSSRLQVILVTDADHRTKNKPVLKRTMSPWDLTNGQN